MTISAEMADILGRNMDGVSRLVLRHERCQAFRWMVIVEILLVIILSICLIPILLLLAVAGRDAMVELPSMSGRFYNRWHEIRLTVLDPQGRTLADVSQRPLSKAEGDGIVASILNAAKQQTVVVIEMLGEQGAANELMEVWYGGRPLLCHPNIRTEQLAGDFVRQAGFEIEAGQEEVTIKHVRQTLGVVASWIIFIVIAIPLSPILIFVEQGRRLLKDLWLTIRGVPPGADCIVIRAESIRTFFERGGEKRDEMMIDGTNLLGVTFSPTLAYTGEARRMDASFRLIGLNGSQTIPINETQDIGDALRDYIANVVIRLRNEKPELGLAGEGPRPTRCPYCGGLYDMQPGSKCPYCSAPAGSTP